MVNYGKWIVKPGEELQNYCADLLWTPIRVVIAIVHALLVSPKWSR